jgi:hypothetical protein
VSNLAQSLPSRRNYDDLETRLNGSPPDTPAARPEESKLRQIQGPQARVDCLGFFYWRRAAPKLLTRDEARCIAANIAKLPELAWSVIWTDEFASKRAV